MRNRTYGINIRVTEQEKKRIERYAKKCRLSVSEYLRQLAKGHTPNEVIFYGGQVIPRGQHRSDEPSPPAAEAMSGV